MLFMSDKEFRDFIKEIVRETVKEIIRSYKLLDQRLTKEWYCMAECARLKGVSQGYLIDHPEKQPGGGKHFRKICGWKRVHISVVAPWLTQDDDELDRENGKR